MSIAGARARVAAALAGTFTTVVDHPRDVDQVQAHTAVVVLERVEPQSVACPAPVATLSVWVITPYTDPGTSDDDLDALLDRTLAALTAAAITWTQADRATWRDRSPAYRVTIELEGV